MYLGEDNYTLKALEFRITLRCNLRCKHCAVEGGVTHDDREREMSWDDYERVITDAKSMGLQRVDITGGEPLFKKKLTLKIIKLCTELDVHTKLNTNAVLINDEFINELKAVGLKEVRVSIDGSNEDVYQRIRGDRESFSLVNKGISMLVKSTAFRVGGRLTLTSANYHDVGNCIDMAVNLGVDYFRIKPVVTVGLATGNPLLSLRPEEQIEAIKSVIEKKKENKIEIDFRGPCMQFILGDDDAGLHPCECAREMLSIEHTGDVTPCEYIELGNISVGNIKEKSIKEIYNSEFISRMRNEIPDSCNGCNYINKCRGGCMAMNYNLSGKINSIPQTCKAIKGIVFK